MGLRKKGFYPPVDTLPSDASEYAGQVLISPRWPLVGSLPDTVVDGQRLRIAEEGKTYGREYLGISGLWVPQPSVTMGVWQSDGLEWWPLSPIPDRPVLPADDSTFGTVVIVGGVTWRWIDGQWEIYSINSGNQILLSDDNGSILIDDNYTILEWV